MSEDLEFFVKFIGVFIVFLFGLVVLATIDGWGKIVGVAMVFGSIGFGVILWKNS